MRHLRTYLLFALVLGGAALRTEADGKFFGQRAAVDQPGIVAQRALVVHNHGQQTLVVQSDLTAMDQEAGWVLPLPRVPTSIEACPGNTLTALAGVVQPQVVEISGAYLVASGGLAFLILLACLDVGLRTGKRSLGEAIRSWLAVMLVLAALVSVLLPSLSTAGATRGGVDLLQQTRAGVYDVRVIRGETAGDVLGWLEDGGFALSPEAEQVLDAYVAEDWCFLTARVRPESGGTTTQHPVRVTFPSERPIYPMRLTGVGGQPVHLDLFVVGAHAAVVEGLRPWVVSRCRRIGYESFPVARYAIPHEMPEVYRVPGILGLSGVSDLLWDGCVLTRLRGRVAGDQLQDDLVIGWSQPERFRARVYGPGSAGNAAGCIGLLIGAIVLGLLTSGARGQRLPLRARLVRHGLPSLMLAVIGAGVCYGMLEVVPVTRRAQLEDLGRLKIHEYALANLTAEPAGGAFPAAYRDLLKIASEQMLSKATPVETDHPARPGDFRIDEAEGGWRLLLIDRNLVEVSVWFDADGRPRGRSDPPATPATDTHRPD